MVFLYYCTSQETKEVSNHQDLLNRQSYRGDTLCPRSNNFTNGVIGRTRSNNFANGVVGRMKRAQRALEDARQTMFVESEPESPDRLTV